MSIGATSFHRASVQFRLPLVLFLALGLSLGGPIFAQTLYLASSPPDGVALLPPPPSPGSNEEAADLTTVRAVFNGRTAEDEKSAFRSSSLSFSLFGALIDPSFDLTSLPKTDALLQKVRKEMGTAIDVPKDYFKRKRPYQLDANLSLRNPEPSYSYPSGHSTRGTTYALIFAELFPEKKDSILALGRGIGWDRIIIGKHFPTDVYAGRVLGQHIFHSFMASPAFQQDLAAAKAEIATMAKAAGAH